MIAYFFNYIKPCVDGNVNPIFKELPVRGYNTSNHLFERFLSDCDLKGSSLDKFMKDAALGAKLYGVQAIFIDNFPEEELRKINLLEAVKFNKITNDIDIRFNYELNTKVENIDANEKLIDEM